MMKLSVLIPAYNEEHTIGACVDQLIQTLGDKYGIPYEIVVVNDNSTDDTEGVIRSRAEKNPAIRLVGRRPPRGYGRAIRSGLEVVTGDAIVIMMGDLSDDPEDVVAYYRKLEEGYGCVFGSRFIKGSRVQHYPPFKRIVNRAVNRLIQLMFWTRFNDLTNAFKAYRADVVRECGPYRASHFNITIEMSLSALIRRYSIAQIPISWSGRTWGSSNLKIREMGRKYLCILLKIFFERMLIADDLMAERLAHDAQVVKHVKAAERRNNQT